jgi:phosphoglycolate phosphatase
MLHDARLIVFDWDGTLMDSEARILACLRAAIDDLRLTPRSDDQLRNIIGLGLQEALRTLYPQGSPADYVQLTARYRHYFLDADATPSEMFPGAGDMLRQLHGEGYFLAVATGKGRQGLNKVLDETGLGELFHYSRCADECHSKPHPQMLHEIMDFLGVPPAQSLMIGDTEYDLQMANNAGVKSLAVSYGVHDKARLLACQPLDCVDSPAGLHEWLSARLKPAA